MLTDDNGYFLNCPSRKVGSSTGRALVLLTGDEIFAIRAGGRNLLLSYSVLPSHLA